MAEKLAPEKRHSFIHNGLSISLSHQFTMVWASETMLRIFIFPVLTLFFSGEKVFEWDQTLEEVDMYINLPPNVHSKQFYCKIQSKHLELGIKGNPPYLNVCFRICILQFCFFFGRCVWFCEFR